MSVIAGCGSSKHVSASPAPVLPKDPGPVTVIAGQATTLNLAGGADLIIPPGAMTPGATVRATYQGRPDGNWLNISPTFAPVELITSPPNAIHGLLTLEFPVPVDKIIPGVDPAVQFGISTYDPATKTWAAFDSTYDPARHMVVAQIPHFSWWNPFTWDFHALFAGVLQHVGQMIGTRAGPATCTSGAPAWVESMQGVSNDAGVGVRACAQSQGDILDVEMVNNRPYGQILTYGSGVKWGWHQKAGSLVDLARETVMESHLGSNELYLPPLGQASVGIFQMTPGSNATYHIGPTAPSFALDMTFYVLDQAIDFGPLVGQLIGSCSSFATNVTVTEISATAVRDDLLAITGCVQEAFKGLVAKGLFDKKTVNEVAAIFSTLKSASVVAEGISFSAGVVWRLGDLLSDWLATRNSPLGMGFSVRAKPAPPTTPPSPPTTPPAPPTTPPSPPTTPPAPPTTPPSPPTVPPAPTPHYYETTGPYGSGTFTNYTNAGGTVGTRIQPYQTVEVSCRLTGFKVQDGNVWWYRVKSSPWNDAFYASSDNFYNNGQTSGNINNGVWVDANVPMC